MASPQTDNGFLRIANELADAFGRYRLRGNAWLILWQILRYSYGYNKAEADISRRHLATRTGLSPRHVERELQHLLQSNIIVAVSPGKFRFNKNYDQWLEPTPKREPPKSASIPVRISLIMESQTDSQISTTAANNGVASDSNTGVLQIQKDNLQKQNRKTERAAPSLDFDAIAESWNALAHDCGLPPIIQLSDKRKTAVRHRLKQIEFDASEIYRRIRSNPFFHGDNNRGWRVDFDFVWCSAHNFLKILEGKYDPITDRTKELADQWVMQGVSDARR